jgi:hypothetical protein
MGMLTAVEMWGKRDHAEEWRMWISWANYISNRLEQVPGVKTEILLPKGRSNRSPSLHVEWDISLIPLTGQDVEELLWENNPRIAVSGAGSYLPFPPNMEPYIIINPSQLTAGEEKVIAKSVYELLSNPPQMQKPSGLAAFNLSGLWDLEIQFVASIVNQTFMLEQKGNDIFGTHHASFGARELTGTLHGNDILIRSSYTSQGVRLNFQFTGVVSKDNMDGILSLGEYGRAEWKAKRRQY